MFSCFVFCSGRATWQSPGETVPDRARLPFPPGLQAPSSSPSLHLLSWLFLQLLEALGKGQSEDAFSGHH